MIFCKIFWDLIFLRNNTANLIEVNSCKYLSVYFLSLYFFWDFFINIHLSTYFLRSLGEKRKNRMKFIFHIRWTATHGIKSNHFNLTENKGSNPVIHRNTALSPDVLFLKNLLVFFKNSLQISSKSSLS